MDKAKTVAEALSVLEFRIPSKVGTGDKLFGSVNNIDLADDLQKSGHNLDKKPLW